MAKVGEEPRLYELLAVPKNASTTEIRAAFRRKALGEHPDKGGDPVLFQRINKAYDVLSDPDRRKYYDRTGRVERSVEEDFLEGFGRDAGAGLRKQHHAPEAAVDNSKALQERLSDDADGADGHSASFAAWMRARNVESMVVTTETFLADKAHLSEDSYDKVPLPKGLRGATVMVQRRPPPELDGLAAFEAATEVSFERLPRAVDWKECLVNVTAAPVTPLDGFIARHGADALFRDDLSLAVPHVLGSSGVGVVEVVGPGCDPDLKVGDWVLPARDGLGTFAVLAVWSDRDFIRVPRHLQHEMPAEYMALHRELVLAYYLMETVAADLKPGDALVVNAANGAVGQLIIQLCRFMKLRAIAVVRRHDNHDDTRAWLQFLGAAHVFAEDEQVLPALKRDYASLPKLGFDGVGGFATLKLMRNLAPGSTVVSYGYAGARNVPIPWQVIVHERVTIRGFDVLSWLAEDPVKHRKKMMTMLEALAKLVNAGKLRVSMEEIGVEDWASAVAQTAPGRNTKVVLRMRSMTEERDREADRARAAEESKQAAEEAAASLRVAAEALFVAPPPSSVGAASRCYERESHEAETATLFWVHGNGELPQEYTSLFDRGLAARLPGVTVVMPTPRPSTSTDPQQWFDLDEDRWLRDYVDAPDATTRALDAHDLDLMRTVEAAADDVAAALEKIAAATKKPVALAGFGHGAVVAAYAALTKLSRPVSALVLIGATPLLPHFLKARTKAHLEMTPTICIGGELDRGFEGQRRLVDGGFLAKATFKALPNAHRDVGDEEIQALTDELTTHLAL